MTFTNSNTFHVSKEDMRKMGYEVVDVIVEHLHNLENKPVLQSKKNDFFQVHLNENIPTQGEGWNQSFQTLHDTVLMNTTYSNHPRFFAFVPSPSNYISALADFLASSFNIFTGSWLMSPGAAQIELVTLNWLKHIFSFPSEAGGVFVSGGSMANLTALAVAKQSILQNKLENAIVYCSDQTHASIDKALKVLGFQPEQLCKIPCNEDFKLSAMELKKKIEQDKLIGKIPFCIVANIGTTNTGAVDPLEDIMEIAADHRIWVHGDGAFGAPAILSPEGKIACKGIDKLDSLSLDPHKWLFQSYDIGCVLIRNHKLMQNCFSILPEYLKDSETKQQEINFSDYSIELTRRFRALKLWLTFKVFGLQAFKEAIQKALYITQEATHLIENNQYLEVVSTGLGVVTFRFIPENMYSQSDTNLLNEYIAKELNQDGFAMVSTTILKEKKVIRLCPLHPSLKIEDIQLTLEKLIDYGKKYNKKI
ncbi:pyridoxal phosphate-dependent decarboxylase family protein [Bacillus cereus]|uniref:2,4-diaminobutyrate decarboxylase n=1 Tax=Bacillus cereus TaxID=1396 RepID=A0A2B9E847_BACCE|nr:aminotransferase class V-fold PLP-dependent enzyme [Bacillus cereus]PGM96342.1 2,4-diaminobutyrate decarboxylase [Bacillus cereus]